MDTHRNKNLWNVVQGKDGKDQFDRSREKWRSVTKSYQGGEKYPVEYKKKANWIVHISRRTGF